MNWLWTWYESWLQIWCILNTAADMLNGQSFDIMSHLVYYSPFVRAALIKCCSRKVFEGPLLTCLVYWLLLSPFCAITGLYWLPAGLDYIQSMSLLQDQDTFCLLLSGWGHPPPITSTPFFYFSSSSSSFGPSFSLLPPLFLGLRLGTCDDRGVSVGHNDPLCCCSHWPGSQCIPPCSRSPSICSLCSQDPHSCPSRVSTVRPYRGLVTLGYNGREACANVSLSNPSSLFFPVIQISYCEFYLIFLPLYLPLSSGFLVTVCLSISLQSQSSSVFLPHRPVKNLLNRSTVAVIGSKLAPFRGQLSVMFVFWAEINKCCSAE